MATENAIDGELGSVLEELFNMSQSIETAKEDCQHSIEFINGNNSPTSQVGCAATQDAVSKIRAFGEGLSGFLSKVNELNRSIRV